MVQCHHWSPSPTRDTSSHTTWCQMSSRGLGVGWQVHSRSTDFLNCLLSKLSGCRSALSTDSHTSPPPPSTTGGIDELEQNTVVFRVDHHLVVKGLDVHIFLEGTGRSWLNCCLASQYDSLALNWERTNSFMLTETNHGSTEDDPSAWGVSRLLWSSNQDLSMLCTRMALVGTKYLNSRDICSLKTSPGWSADQMFYQIRDPVLRHKRILINIVFEINFPTSTQVWNSQCHRNNRRQRWVIRVTSGRYNKARNISHQEVKSSTTCMGRADYQLITTMQTQSRRQRQQNHNDSSS